MSFHISQNEPLDSFCNAVIVVVGNNSVSCCKHLQTDTDLAFISKTTLQNQCSCFKNKACYMTDANPLQQVSKSCENVNIWLT